MKPRQISMMPFSSTALKQRMISLNPLHNTESSKSIRSHHGSWIIMLLANLLQSRGLLVIIS